MILKRIDTKDIIGHSVVEERSPYISKKTGKKGFRWTRRFIDIRELVNEKYAHQEMIRRQHQAHQRRVTKNPPEYGNKF